MDPSYLSPHVNLAARLEGATKQCVACGCVQPAARLPLLTAAFLRHRYGVPILMSGAFVDALLLEEHTAVWPPFAFPRPFLTPCLYRG